MNFATLLTSAPLHLVVTGAFLVALSVFFILSFCRPAWREARRLTQVLRALESKDLRDARDPQLLDKAFPKDGELAHLWREYKKTLYATSIEGPDGIAEVRWTSTAPAEVVWNSQLVVDQRVHAEFFKHLPGIFTGLGIIGTFFGLIEGLKRFEVSANADIVRGSLESLMHSVGEAFVISATAIALAIFVTFVEKLVLTTLYGKVDAIAASLDRRFQAAVAEKFLELTVKHTEQAATQLKHLKGELLKDLRPILQELSDKHTETLERLADMLQDRLTKATSAQIEAAQRNNEALGETISGAITTSLAGPLDDIKNAVQKASGDQSAAAVSMLQDVMTSFSERLSDLFGSQITGINELNQRAALTMQEAVTRLNDLVVALQDAGERSSDSMAERMAEANERMQSSLEELGKKVGEMLQEFQTAQAQALEAGRQRELETNERTQATINSLASSVGSLIRQIATASSQMQQSVATLSNTTASAISSLSEGANKVNAASGNFADASGRVTGAMNQVAAVTTRLTDLTTSLTVAASSLRQGLDDYKAHRESVGKLISDLNGLVENAKTDARITSDVLRRIEDAAKGLNNAQLQAEQFMAGVAEVLGKAHDSFREAMLKTVRENNHEFHQQLAAAVALLSTSIQELDAVLSGVNPNGRGK